MLQEEEYLRLAQDELQALVQAIDELPFDSLECELSNDIITLDFSDDESYVINSHRAARQIWMAAEHTAWHFDWKADSRQWIASKNGEELWSALRNLLIKKLGSKFEFRANAAHSS